MWCQDHSRIHPTLEPRYVAQFLGASEAGERLCGIYTLFAMFQTQIRFPDAADAVVRIRVTPMTWRHVKHIYVAANYDRGFGDAAGAVQTLCRDGAFVFAAAPLHRRDEPISSGPDRTEAPLHLVWGHSAAAASKGPLPRVDELFFPPDLAAKYQQSKRALWTTELAEADLDSAAVDEVAGHLPASLSHAPFDQSERVGELHDSHVAARAKRLHTVLRMVTRPDGKRRKAMSAAPPPGGTASSAGVGPTGSTNPNLSAPVLSGVGPQLPPSLLLPLPPQITPRILEDDSTPSDIPLSMPDF